MESGSELKEVEIGKTYKLSNKEATKEGLAKQTQEWTDKHYDHKYVLTKEDIKKGFIRLDVYKVSNVWRVGEKDNSGALWHILKTIPRFGVKNSIDREIKALYNQVKGLAREHGVELEEGL